MGVEVWLWLWLLVLWRPGIVVPSSIEWVFKACARHRQIFTPVTPQLYNIYITHAFFRVASTHTIRIRFVDHGRATLLIVVHNSICQVPRQPVQTPGPRRKTRHPGSNMPGPRSRSGPWVSSTRIGRGPRSALCQSVGSCGPQRVNVFVLDGGAGASGDFDLILISCDGLYTGTMGFRAWFHLKMRLT